MRQTIHCTDKKINSEHTSVGLTHACPKTNDSQAEKTNMFNSEDKELIRQYLTL